MHRERLNDYIEKEVGGGSREKEEEEKKQEEEQKAGTIFILGFWFLLFKETIKESGSHA